MKQRGIYKPVNDRGSPVVYEPNDIVTFEGGSYKALRRNTYLDGSPKNEGFWEPLMQSISHTAGETPPTSPNEGDEWYDTINGKLFKYLNDGNSVQWVEII